MTIVLAIAPACLSPLCLSQAPPCQVSGGSGSSRPLPQVPTLTSRHWKILQDPDLILQKLNPHQGPAVNWGGDTLLSLTPSTCLHAPKKPERQRATQWLPDFLEGRHRCFLIISHTCLLLAPERTRAGTQGVQAVAGAGLPLLPFPTMQFPTLPRDPPAPGRQPRGANGQGERPCLLGTATLRSPPPCPTLC